MIRFNGELENADGAKRRVSVGSLAAPAPQRFLSLPITHSNRSLSASTYSSDQSTPKDMDVDVEIDSGAEEEEEDDGKIVKAVIDKLDSGLNLKLDEDFDDDIESSYRVTLYDFETGRLHELKGVRVLQSGDESELTIASEQMAFRTAESFHGRRADRLLVRLMGPEFAGQRLSVYRGRIEFRYRDEICVPIPSPEKKTVVDD